MNICILGGGMSAISLAYFLQKNSSISSIHIYEKDKKLGGLCRSFNCKGIYYDVGPHIIFSKHKEILKLMLKLLQNNKNSIKRSNQILLNGNYIKYPFENNLSSLKNRKLIDQCLISFKNNPYENIVAKNMLQFFLKTFGEGITNIYLRPYNEKIWKYDPSCMDTQMVDRIPKPPLEDIIRSAEGNNSEGYLHQLFFHYPKEGGIESLVKSFINHLNKKKIFINTDYEIKSLSKKQNYFIVNKDNDIKFDKIISTIPLEKLGNIYNKTPKKILKISSNLRFNSIITCLVNIKGIIAKDHFAMMVPDKSIIFHRLSRLDFLGKNYSIKGTTTFLVEVTYREGSYISALSDKMLFNKICSGLKKIKYIKDRKDINFYELKKFSHAYVIYDLDHRKNVDDLIKYYKKQNIIVNGRFGSYEYLNSDQIIKQSLDLSKELF